MLFLPEEMPAKMPFLDTLHLLKKDCKLQNTKIRQKKNESFSPGIRRVANFQKKCNFRNVLSELLKNLTRSVRVRLDEAGQNLFEYSELFYQKDIIRLKPAVFP